MPLFDTATRKDRFRTRNKIVKEVALPALQGQGFIQAPYPSWFGIYPGNRVYTYELCRLKGPDLLQLVEIFVHYGDRYIQIFVNVVRLQPAPATVEALNVSDPLHFGMPPISLTKMRLRLDGQKGPPILRIFDRQHKLGSSWTSAAFERRAKRLSQLIEQDMLGIDGFFDRWHELHEPQEVHWTMKWEERRP